MDGSTNQRRDDQARGQEQQQQQRVQRRPRRASARASSVARPRKAVAVAVSMTVGAMFGEGAQAAKNVHVQRVTAGSAKFTESGLTTTVVAADRTIIDYTRFDVARMETVQFVLPTLHSSILNRINSADPSHIDGHIIGNGSIYFANPSGVLFGPHAVLNAGNLYAAAGNISNAEFQAGQNHFTAGTGPVVNEGTIKADAVTLVGRQVINHGVIVGKSVVTMASGDDVYVGDVHGGVMVKMNPAAAQNAGEQEPQLPLGAGDVYSLAISNTGQVKGPAVRVQAGTGTASISGQIDASSHAGKGGSISITAPSVAVSNATIDASGKTGGGTVLVGGDAHGQGTLPHAIQTTIDATSTIKADATDKGDGGKVVAWSDQTTQFHGTISARGGASGGDGGFVETSGHVLGTSGATVDASAPHGTPGTWLLDPFDLEIKDNGGTSTKIPTADLTVPLVPTDDSILDVSVVNNALSAGTSLEVKTAGTDPLHPSPGTITVTDPIAKTGAAAATLTLHSAGDIDVNASIGSNAGPLGVTLQAGADVHLNAAVSTKGGDFNSSGVKFTSTSSGAIDTSAAGPSFGGVSLNHTGAVSIGGTINAGSVTLTTTSSVAVSAAVTTNGNPFQSGSSGTPNGGTFSTTAGGAIDTSTAGPSNTHVAPYGDVTINHNGNVTIGGAIAGNAVKVSANSVGSGITLSANVTSAAGQTYSNAVIIQNLSASTPVTLADTGGTAGIDFKGTLSSPSTPGAGSDLVIDAHGGTALFEQAVGGPIAGLNPLTSLAVISGPTQVNGGGIYTAKGSSTAGGQTYFGTLSLGGDTTLSGTSLTSVTATPLLTIDGNSTHHYNLTFDLSNGVSTADFNLINLGIVTQAGPTTIGGTFTASNNLVYSGLVTITGTTDIKAGSYNITFADGVTDEGHNYDLTLESANPGVIKLGGLISVGTLHVGTLPTGNAPIQLLDGAVSGTKPKIKTTEGQTYGSVVTLFDDATLTASGTNAISFKGFDGSGGTAAHYSLTLQAGGPTTLDNNVLANIGDLTVGPADITKSTGLTILDGPLMTNGNQTFNDPVQVRVAITATPAPAALTAGGNVAFNNTVTGTTDAGFTSDLKIAAGTNAVSFEKPVGLASASLVPLTSLDVTAAQINIDGGSIATTSAQSYAGPVATTASLTTLSSSSAAQLTFTSIDAGSNDLALQFGGNLPINSATIPAVHTLTIGQIGHSLGITQLKGTFAPTGDQRYYDPVQLTDQTTLAPGGSGAGNVTFGNIVNGGGFTLAINTTGLTLFGGSAAPSNDGKVGAAAGQALKSLLISGPADIENASEIDTTGDQTFSKGLTIGTYKWSNVAFNTSDLGTITFGTAVADQLIGSTASVSITAGNIVFNGPVHLSSLTANINSATGTTAINGGSVTTRHDQNYNVPLPVPASGHPAATLGGTVGATTLTGETVTFNSTLEANFQKLTITANLFNQIKALTHVGTPIFGNYSDDGAPEPDNHVPADYVPPTGGGGGGGGGGTGHSPDPGPDPTRKATVIREIDIDTDFPTPGGQEYDQKVRIIADNISLSAPAITFEQPLIGGGVTGGPDTIHDTATNRLTLQANQLTFGSYANLGGLTIRSYTPGASVLIGGGLAPITIVTNYTGPGTGNQVYVNPVLLTSDAVLRGNGGGNPTTLTYNSINGDGRHDLTLEFTGPISIDGPRVTGIQNLTVGPSNTVDSAVNFGPWAGALGAFQLIARPGVGAPLQFSEARLSGMITTSAGQTYNEPVELITGVTVKSDPSGVPTASPNPANIVFGATVDSQLSPATPNALFTSTSGLTIFQGEVGSFSKLKQLWVMTGPTEIDAPSVSTQVQNIGDPAMRFAGNVTLYGPNTTVDPTGADFAKPAPVLLTDGNGGTVTFFQDLSGAQATHQRWNSNLEVRTDGLSAFGGSVTLGSIKVTKGSSEIDGGSVATVATGSLTNPVIGTLQMGQYYLGDVTINGATLPGHNPVSLTDGNAGAITFGGKLNGLPTDSTSANSDVTISTSLSSASSPTLGTITFGKAVDLSSLTVSAGNVEVDGGGVSTHGHANGGTTGQSYANDVTLNGKHDADPSLVDDVFLTPATPKLGLVNFVDDKSGAIKFLGKLSGTSANQTADSVVDISSTNTIAPTSPVGNVSFGGDVTLGALKVINGTTTAVNGVTISTLGEGSLATSPALPSVIGTLPMGQYYSGAATVTGLVNLKDSADGAITFHSTLKNATSDAPGEVTIDTSNGGGDFGAVTLGDNVVVASLHVLHGATQIDGTAVTTKVDSTTPNINGISGKVGQYYNDPVTLHGDPTSTDPTIPDQLGANLPPQVAFTGIADRNAGGIIFNDTLTGIPKKAYANVSISTASSTAIGQVTFRGDVNVGSLYVSNGNVEIDSNVTTHGTLGSADVPSGHPTGANNVGQYYGNGSVTIQVQAPPVPLAPAATTHLVDVPVLAAPGDIVLTNGVNDFAFTQNAPSTANLIVATPGIATFAQASHVGSLKVTQGDAEIDGGSINTAGVDVTTLSAGQRLGQYYAFNVKLNDGHYNLPDGHDPVVTKFPVALNDSNAGTITFHQTLTGPSNNSDLTIDSVQQPAGPLATLGQVTFGGIVNVSSLAVTHGHTEIDGGQVATHGTASLTLADGSKRAVGQYYHDDVTLDGNDAADPSPLPAPASPAPVSISDSAAGAITFGSTLNGSVAQGQPSDSNLTITTSNGSTSTPTHGLVTFGGKVDLGSLTVAAGQSEIDGGNVTTHGTLSQATSAGPIKVGQYYADPVALNGALTSDPDSTHHTNYTDRLASDGHIVSLSDANRGAITFHDTLSGVNDGALSPQLVNSNLEITINNLAGAPQPGVTFGGAVSLGSLKVLNATPSEIDGNSVATRATGTNQMGAQTLAGTAPVGQYYSGSVVLNGNHLADPAKLDTDLKPEVTLSDSGAGAITTASTVSGSQDPALPVYARQPIVSNLTINTQTGDGTTHGQVTFGGAVDVGSVKVLAGHTEIDGGSVTTFANGAADPAKTGTLPVGQFYRDDVTLNGPHQEALIADATVPALVNLADKAAGAITFESTLTGSTNPLNVNHQAIDSNLVINTNTAGALPDGQVTFGGAVDLGSLKVPTGKVEIDGPSILTRGTGSQPAADPVIGSITPVGQYYHDPVVLNGPRQGAPDVASPTAPFDVAITDANAGAITFDQTLSGSLAQGQKVNSNLTISTSDGPSPTSTHGTVTFGGKVDLGSLTVAAGHTEIDGGSVTTAGTGAASQVPTGSLQVGQYYHDDVTLNDKHLASDAISDAITPAPAVVSFTDNGSASITFASWLNGVTSVTNSNVKISTSGGPGAGPSTLVTFGGTVDAGSLQVLAGDTEIDGGRVTTAGPGIAVSSAIGTGNAGQYYAGKVTINGDHKADSNIQDTNPITGVLLADNAANQIAFHQELFGGTGGSDVVIDSNHLASYGLTTFGGQVTLSSLTVVGPTEVDGGLVQTYGSSNQPIGHQMFGGDVLVNGPHPIDSGIKDQNPPVKFQDITAGPIYFGMRLLGPADYSDVIVDTQNALLVPARHGNVTFQGRADLDPANNFSVNVGSLRVTAGFTEIDGGLVQTHGTAPAQSGSDNVGQLYTDAVTLDARAPYGAASPLNYTKFTDTPNAGQPNADIVFLSTLNDPSATPLRTNVTATTPGMTVFGKTVEVGSLTVAVGQANINADLIKSNGTGSNALGQLYVGPVVLNSATYNLATNQLQSLTDANAGSITTEKTLFGSLAQHQLVDTDLTITTNSGASVGQITFGGAVDLGSLQVMAGHTEIDGGSVTTNGTGDSHLSGVTAKVGQYYHDDVALNGPHHSDAAISSHNPVKLDDTGAGTITFRTTLDGSVDHQAANSDLSINTAAGSSLGHLTFGGAVDLGSLQVMAGHTEIDGKTLTTHGSGTSLLAGVSGNVGQYYHDDVVLNGPHTSDPAIGDNDPVSMTDVAAGSVTFRSTLTGSTAKGQPIDSNLTLRSDNGSGTLGQITFGDAVDLGSLDVAAGHVEIDGKTVATHGTATLNGLTLGQYYHDDVTINGHHVNDPSGIADKNPAALTDDNAGSITFRSTLDGSTAQHQPINSDLSITTARGTLAGQVTFGGAVDIGSLKVMMGNAEIDGKTVTTYGTGSPVTNSSLQVGQYYYSPVTINGPHAIDSTIVDQNPATLTDKGAGAITFHDTLSGSTASGQPGNSDLTIATNAGSSLGQVTFGGAVKLGSLQVMAGHTEIDGGSVMTAGTGTPDVSGAAGSIGQYYHDDVTINGNRPADPSIAIHNVPPVALTDTGAGTITFHDVVNGSLAQHDAADSDLTIDTHSGATLGQLTFGGAVNLGSLKVLNGTTEIDGGSITTNGTGSAIGSSSMRVGQYFHNNVVLNGAHAADPTITLAGANVVLTDKGSGAVTFDEKLDGATGHQSIDSNLSIDTKGWSTFGGAVTLGSLKVVTGPAEIDGGSVATHGSGSSLSGSSLAVGQYYAGNVVVNGSAPADPSIADAGTNVLLSDTRGGTITFLSKLNGSNPAQSINTNLTLDTAGLSTFGGTVNLGSLKVVTGGAEIDGGLIATLGTGSSLAGSELPVGQYYAGDVTINGMKAADSQITRAGPDVSLTDLSNGGGITFLKTLSGSSASGQPLETNLTIDAHGLSTFGGAVSLGSLKVLTGDAEIDGGSVATFGTGSALPGSNWSGVGQFYAGNVVVNGNHPADAAVTLAVPNATLSDGSSAGTITFAKTLDGATAAGDPLNTNLTIDSRGLATFGGAVKLGSLNVKTGPAEIDGGSITTAGTGSGGLGQSYAGVVTLNDQRMADPAITLHPSVALSDSGGGRIDFVRQLDGALAAGQAADSDLTINTAGLTRLGGAVSLGSLNVSNASGTTIVGGGSVDTAKTQNFENPVTITANSTFSSKGDDVTGGIAFQQSLVQQSQQTLTVNTAGSTEFHGDVTVTSLTTDAAGQTGISSDGNPSNATKLTVTAGNMTFGDRVTVTGNTTFSAEQPGAAILFEQDASINDRRGGNVAINSTHGAIRFGGAAPSGHSAVLAGDTVSIASSGGPITFNGSAMTSAGDTKIQSASGAIQFSGPATFAGGTNLVDSGGGNISFVGIANTLGSSNTIQSRGGQITFNAAASLRGATNLVNSDGGTIAFVDDATTSGNSNTIESAARPAAILFKANATFGGGANVVDSDGGDIIFGAGAAPAQTKDAFTPVSPGAGANVPYDALQAASPATTFSATFGGQNAQVETHGGTLAFTGSVTLGTTGQLWLSTSDANIVSPAQMPTIQSTAPVSGAAVSSTFSTGTTHGPIDFFGAVNSQGGAATIQSDYGNIQFWGPVGAQGGATKLVVATHGNTSIDPLKDTTVPNSYAKEYLDNANVFFHDDIGKAPSSSNVGSKQNGLTAGVGSLQVSARNILVHDVVAKGDVTLQTDPSLHLIDVQGTPTHFGYGPYFASKPSHLTPKDLTGGSFVSVTDAHGNITSIEPPPPDGLLMIAPLDATPNATPAVTVKSIEGQVSLNRAERQALNQFNGKQLLDGSNNKIADLIEGTVPSSVATIVDHVYDPFVNYSAQQSGGGTGSASNATPTKAAAKAAQASGPTMSISGQDVTFGQDEKLTSFGSVDLNASDTARISSIAAYDTIKVTAHTVLLEDRPAVNPGLLRHSAPGNRAAENYVKSNDSLGDPDNMLDFFAGNQITFTGSLMAMKFEQVQKQDSAGNSVYMYTSPHAANSSDVRFGVDLNGQVSINGNLNAPFLQQHSISKHRKEQFVLDVIDLGALIAGKSATSANIDAAAESSLHLASDILGPSTSQPEMFGLAGDSTQSKVSPGQDEVNQADRQKLKDMGIYVYDLTPQDLASAVSSHMDYTEGLVPATTDADPPDDSIAQVAAKRMPKALVDQVIEHYNPIVLQSGDLKPDLLKAWNEYRKAHNLGETKEFTAKDVRPFRELLESGRYESVRVTIDRMRNVGTLLPTLGLTPAQVEFCKKSLLNVAGIMPKDPEFLSSSKSTRVDLMESVVFSTTTAAKPLPVYVIEGHAENGGVHPVRAK